MQPTFKTTQNSQKEELAWFAAARYSDFYCPAAVMRVFIFDHFHNFLVNYNNFAKFHDNKGVSSL